MSTLLARLPLGNQVTDLALAAQNRQVIVAWVEHSSGPDIAHSTSTLRVRTSMDGGLGFSPAVIVSPAPGWKRGLDVAYDQAGHHHLIWGQNNKVYHLQDLAGAPSNVFDVHHREPTSERVRYKAYYPPEDGCQCPDCWCEESYLLDETLDPSAPSAPTDASLPRVEERYVYEPSLHISLNTIHIIARIRRTWDGQPVAHKPWLSMADAPVYDPVDQSILRDGVRIRFVVGWRQAWKRAYEPGDETKVATLGTRYQYLYEGSWDEEDSIQLARRPLADRGEKTDAAPGRRKDPWQISVVHRDFSEREAELPSHPQVLQTEGGRLIAVFQKGPVASQGFEQNQIHATWSDDDGQLWSPSTAISSGYLPSLAQLPGGTIGVAHYDAHPQPTVRVVRTKDERRWDRSAPLNVRRPQAAMPQPNGETPDAFRTAPSLAGHDELFLAAWVEAPTSDAGGGRIVLTRASENTEVHHVSLSLPGRRQTQGAVSVTATTENRFYMPVAQDGTLEVRSETALSSDPGAGHVSRGPGPVMNPRTEAAPEAIHVALDHGRGTFRLETAALANTSFAPDGRQTAPLTLALEGQDTLFHAEAVWSPSHPSGNYERAKHDLKKLFRLQSDSPTGEIWGYQVEYALDPFRRDASALTDSTYLAQFERVWVYTQGIALAQFAKDPTEEGVTSAQALARYLCAKAESDSASSEILGWPFSWNTDGDDWKDMRLVTGANAWAVHGLGRFLTSPAYAALPPGSEKDHLQTCYHKALAGLGAHRRTLPSQDARALSLVTAGWTTAGLQYAAEPWKLKTSAGVPITEDRTLRLGYYSVLDAIGYETYTEPPKIRVCHAKPGTDCYAGPSDPDSEEWEISEAVWLALRQRVKAQNVVTEHNVDVLAVLNHALDYAEALGLSNTNELEGWRNSLRDGIFVALWDDKLWRDEFSTKLEAMTVAKTSGQTAVQKHRQAVRKQRMEKALAEGGLGRVVTGGAFLENHQGRLHFEPSTHSAIDNCSWLSLSVDYRDLAEQAPEDPSHNFYVERLAQCLRYTVVSYARELGFGPPACNLNQASCPPETTYRGAHYFQNEFKDPYILPSERQESSYHLEATLGLIMGLHVFLAAHPEHSASELLHDEAQSLWSGAQMFVRDHGFPYSSQRIQDLSTLLSSSTAMIWFIDVHDFLDAQDGALNRPLPHYSQTFNIGSARAFMHTAYQRLKKDTSTSVSGNLKDEGVPPLFDSPSSLLISGSVDGAPYTLVEEQALASLVALGQGDIAQATAWLTPLRASAFRPNMEGPGAFGFPVAIHSKTGQPLNALRDTGSQMLVLYALAGLLLAAEGQDDAKTDLIRGLQSLQTVLFVEGSGPVSGLFRAGLAAYPVQYLPMAKIDDNILAYFAWSLASRATASSLAGEDFLGRAEDLKVRLLELCANGSGLSPIQAVFADGKKDLADRPETYAMCALFAAKVGEVGLAEALLAELDRRRAQDQEGFASWASRDRRSEEEGRADRASLASSLESFPDLMQAPSFSAWRDHFVAVRDGRRWARLSMEVLARRALAPIDSRQEEMALDLLASWTPAAREEAAFDVLAASLMAIFPNGVFGVDGLPVALVSTPQDRSGFRALGAPEQADKAFLLLEQNLLSLYYDTVRTLLVSRVFGGDFDTTFHRLVFLRFALAQAASLVPPAEWLDTYARSKNDWISATDRELLTLCEAPWSLPGSRADMEKGLGISCEAVSGLFARLRTARIGTDGAFEASLKQEGYLAPYQVLQELRALLRWGQSEFFVEGGKEATCLSCGHPMPLPSHTDEDAPLAEIQDRLRQGYKLRVQEILAHEGEGPVLFRVPYLNVVHALNPSASQYWRRSSVFFRAALAENEIRIEVQGVQLQNLPLPQDDAFAANVSAFRRFVHTYAGGNLPRAADQSGLGTASLHRILREGQIPSEIQKALVNGLGLARLEEAEGEEAFGFLVTDENQGEAQNPARFYQPTFGFSFINGVSIIPLLGQAGAQFTDEILLTLLSQTPWLASALSGLVPTAPMPEGSTLEAHCDPSRELYSTQKVNGYWILCVRPGFRPVANGSPSLAFESVDAARAAVGLWRGIYPPHESVIIVEAGANTSILERREPGGVVDMLVVASGATPTAEPPPKIRALDFDPIAGTIPLETDAQLLAYDLLIFYCSQDPFILNEARLGDPRTDVLTQEGRLENISIITRNARTLRKGLTARELRAFPFHAFDIDCRYILRSLRTQEFEKLRPLILAFIAYLRNLSPERYTSSLSGVDVKQLFREFLGSLPEGATKDLTVHSAVTREFVNELEGASSKGLSQVIEALEERISDMDKRENEEVAKLDPMRLPVTTVGLKAKFDADHKNILVSFGTMTGPAQVAIAIYKKKKGRPGDYIEYIFRTEDGQVFYPAEWAESWAGAPPELRNLGLDILKVLAAKQHTTPSLKDALVLHDSPWIRSKVENKTLFEFLAETDDVLVTMEINPDELDVFKPKNDSVESVLGDLLGQVVEEIANDPLSELDLKQKPSTKRRQAPMVYTESVPIEANSDDKVFTQSVDDASIRDQVRRIGDQTPSENISPDNAGSTLVLGRGKSLSRTTASAVKLVDDLVSLPKELVVAALAGSSALGHLGSLGTEVDTGLETMFIGSDIPSSAFWTPQGVIDAQATLAPPLATYLRDETALRTLPIYTATHIKNPLTGPHIRFENQQIYYLRADWTGLESPLTGQVGFLTPTEGSLWEVYTLNTTHPRSAVLEAFIQNHALWRKVNTITESLPESFRRPWLFVVELAIRSDFDRKAAENHIMGLSGPVTPHIAEQRPVTKPVTSTDLLAKLENLPASMVRRIHGYAGGKKPTAVVAIVDDFDRVIDDRTGETHGENMTEALLEELTLAAPFASVDPGTLGVIGVPINTESEHALIPRALLGAVVLREKFNRGEPDGEPVYVISLSRTTFAQQGESDEQDDQIVQAESLLHMILDRARSAGILVVNTAAGGYPEAWWGEEGLDLAATDHRIFPAMLERSRHDNLLVVGGVSAMSHHPEARRSPSSNYGARVDIATSAVVRRGQISPKDFPAVEPLEAPSVTPPYLSAVASLLALEALEQDYDPLPHEIAAVLRATMRPSTDPDVPGLLNPRLALGAAQQVFDQPKVDRPQFDVDTLDVHHVPLQSATIAFDTATLRGHSTPIKLRDLERIDFRAIYELLLYKNGKLVGAFSGPELAELRDNQALNFRFRGLGPVVVTAHIDFLARP